MALTEEQKERIRKNRERALEIQRKRKREEAEKREAKSLHTKSDGSPRSREGQDSKVKEEEERGDEVEDLEEFEVNASPLVSKKEAMQKYCLPEGTMAVCSYVEKQNPHRKGWTPMKLYNRSEIRRRARKRFGGKEGLIAERNRRAQKRLEKDLLETRNIFKS